MPKQKSNDPEAHKACIDKCKSLYDSIGISDIVLERIYRDWKIHECVVDCLPKNVIIPPSYIFTMN